MVNVSPLPNTEPEPKRGQQWWLIGGLATLSALCLCVGLVSVGFIGYRVWKDNQPFPQTGQDVPLQYAGHVRPGDAHEPYNSDPPTSGAHYAQPAPAGFYRDAPADEVLVHNLEDGYVIIWYNCQDLTTKACGQLQADIEIVMDKAGNSPITYTPKLTAVPRPAMDTQLALTTWGWLDKFDTFDEERILNFINAFRDKAPEPNVP